MASLPWASSPAGLPDPGPSLAPSSAPWEYALRGRGRVFMLKAAVIGAGYIAREHLGALRSLPGVRTAGLCDLSATMAEATAEEFDVEAWFTDHRRMLEQLRAAVLDAITEGPAQD